ncbi:MAG: DUF302 domain-containing protein [Candidatus Eremiobacteraeota bacterium]|nr:DUF302 domain-containing protein [Candidatus Eremiobacteraeota bacterium]
MEETGAGAIGLLTTTSRYPVAETVDRLADAVHAAGNTVFARIDHAAGAAEVGLSMPPTQVLIFGNAVVGTPLMQAAPTIAIDLPLRFLVWEDEAGTTRVAWNDPIYLAARHGAQHVEARLKAIGEKLAALAASLAPSS